MRYLVITDIHANIPAFEAVLNDAEYCDKTIFLGDIANFGAFPSECVDLLMDLNPICIMGNHDQNLLDKTPLHKWDIWAKSKLSDRQINFISSFQKSVIFNKHILLMHGIFDQPEVQYDILPNTPDFLISNAFKGYTAISTGIDSVWFGHYHYDIQKNINGIDYHCLRPVGQQRDHDICASYYIYENSLLTQKRVPYDIDKNIAHLQKIDCFTDEVQQKYFIEFLKNAYHPLLMSKDIAQMKINDSMENQGRK